MMERFQSSSTEFSFKGKLQTYKILQVFSLLSHNILCSFPAINVLCLNYLTWNMLLLSLNLCMKCRCISLRIFFCAWVRDLLPRSTAGLSFQMQSLQEGLAKSLENPTRLPGCNRSIIIFLPKHDHDSHSPTGVRSCWWGVTTLLRKLPMNLRKWGPTVLTLWRWVSDLSDTLVY